MSSHGGVVDSSTAVKFLQKKQAVAVAAMAVSPSPSQRHHHHQLSAEIGTVPQLLAGGISGAFSKTCTAPLAPLTILFQRITIYYNGIWHVLRTICRDEGVFGLYKGLGPTLLRHYLWILLGGESSWKEWVDGHAFTTAAYSGHLGTSCELKGYTEGLRCLYRGIHPEYYKVVPGVGIVFITYETLKKLLSEPPFF